MVTIVFMLVLASASPRRQELLLNAGIEFTVRPTNIAEIPEAKEGPRDMAERLARAKAEAAQRESREHYILGADTVVFVTGQILNKPENANDATRMLRLLSGRTHQVTTGVCLLSPNGRAADLRSETTLVTVNELTDEDIRAYVASGEPMDKAGAYGIQGIASRWISRIEGDYFNVVGLPVALVYRMLRESGAL